MSMLQLWFIANTVFWPFSLTIGGFSLSANLVVPLVAVIVWLWKDRKIAVSTAKILIVFFSFSVLSFIVALTGPCTDHFLKSILTMPVLMLLISIGWEVGRRSSNTDWSNLQRTAIWTLALAFSAFIVEILMPSWFPNQASYRDLGKLSGLFSEPSHVAFSLFPCVAILLVAADKRMRRIGALALVGLFLFSRSSTLIVFVAVWFLYRLFLQRKLKTAILITGGLALVIGLNSMTNFDGPLTPTIQRIVGVTQADTADNISSLVYVQGWQDAWNNLMRTRGMGLGLNMMGCSPLPDVSVRSILAFRGLERLNSEDGSFLFAKVVSETGVAAIAFYTAIIWWWIRLERRISGPGKDGDYSAVRMQAALIFCFVTGSFLRSTGYFSGGLLLWVCAVSGASKWGKTIE